MRLQAGIVEFWCMTLFLFITLGTLCNGCKVFDFATSSEQSDAAAKRTGVSQVHLPSDHKQSKIEDLMIFHVGLFVYTPATKTASLATDQ